MYSYVCPDLAKEFAKFDEKPEKYFKQYTGQKVSYIISFQKNFLKLLYQLFLIIL
jgi:hypothetical protein